ncbi:hypothetical protein [Luteimonas saliphila]|uniref:hypothetical protein n=1 Tax=Luteimonas saliphila TaxID=2804919 RepID=UPI00192DBBDF|nr:hypothetical protein [Luteimonas saliphila]
MSVPPGAGVRAPSTAAKFKRRRELVDTALGALERLMAMFKIERYVYLLLTMFAFLLLLYAAYMLITNKPGNTEVLVALFGSSGMIAMSSARIIYFFNRSFKLIEQLIEDGGDG